VSYRKRKEKMSGKEYGRGRSDGQANSYKPPSGDSTFGFGESQKSIEAKKDYSQGWRHGQEDRKKS
tara:strand:+ start:305430 stop:305627 length:198 start_codon:yes stop_codon:yes gene_type:complete